MNHSFSPTRIKRENGHERKIANLILQNIGQGECDVLIPMLELVRLSLHQIIVDAGEPIRSVYFPNDGMASVLAVQPDGKMVEVGLIGKEGFVGIPVVFGFRTNATRVVTQGNSTAYRVPVDVLRRVFPQCPGLKLEMQRFAAYLGFQATQIAACNRLHGVEERLARWLLMSHDRIGDNTMPLTQEFLAQMLGARRTTVSLAASILQKAGMITYTRGYVTISDLAKLKQTACDCYNAIQSQTETWKNEAS
ncbi:MAG TPA: Crp/Fnr family transcriptional regulator [Candidatus Sulfotelmatobacter sp.]|nr:Crp/Fnr family transcriptional regulator [Candidatus Sulfotelmatobacter sp.]